MALTTRNLLALLLAIGVLATAALCGASAKTAQKPPVGLPNFHKTAEGIYRGGAPTTAGLKTLKAMNIHTIIDLRISPPQVKQEKRTAEGMGFTWLNIPMGKEAPTAKQVATFLAVLAKAQGEPVFVHCQHGADRTGSMIGIYRVQVQGWSFANTWTEMRSYGFKPYLSELKEAVRSRAKS